MFVAVILLGILQIIGFAGVCWILVHYFERKQQEIAARINDELVKLTTGKPCQSASVLLAIGQTVGTEAGRSAKASFMANLSQAARQENAQTQDQQLELISAANPAVGGLLGSLGGRRRGSLMKNPLVQLAISALTGGSSSLSPAGPGNGQVQLESIEDRIRHSSE